MENPDTQMTDEEAREAGFSVSEAEQKWLGLFDEANTHYGISSEAGTARMIHDSGRGGISIMEDLALLLGAERRILDAALVRLDQAGVEVDDIPDPEMRNHNGQTLSALLDEIRDNANDLLAKYTRVCAINETTGRGLRKRLVDWDDDAVAEDDRMRAEAGTRHAQLEAYVDIETRLGFVDVWMQERVERILRQLAKDNTGVNVTIIGPDGERNLSVEEHSNNE